VESQRKGGLRKIWRRQVEENIRGIGFTKEDALYRAIWRNGVKLIMSEEVNPATLVSLGQNRIKTGLLLKSCGPKPIVLLVTFTRVATYKCKKTSISDPTHL